MTPTYEVAQRPDNSWGVKISGEIKGSYNTKDEIYAWIDGSTYERDKLVGPTVGVASDTAATVSNSSAVSPAGQKWALPEKDPGAVAWRVKDFADGWFYYGRDQWIEADRAEHDGFRVEPLYTNDSDMLEALRVVTDFAATTIEKLGLRDTNDIIGAARAAIKKATGQ